jgi:2-amino-4-hydroxy-6-hydroxymethyldihydropteridine diphosphokinase
VTVLAFVAIGSNLGDRPRLCAEALDHLAHLPDTRIAATSPLIETAPAEGATGGPFLNGVVALDTALSPRELLVHLQGIESALGRPKDHGRGLARTMDLDILFYGDCQIREADLEIPHPRLAERRFVLEPLVAIAPDVRHPVSNFTARALLASLAQSEAEEAAA